MEQIDIAAFILNSSFFKKTPISQIGEENVINMLFFNGAIDSFCPQCNSHSVFLGENDTADKNQAKTNMFCGTDAPGYVKKQKIPHGIYQLDFSCSRNRNHKLYVTFRIDDNVITKIGQSPSPLELVKADHKQYAKLLGECFSDLNSAVILYANNFGIGAFTYLRRIIENYFLKTAFLSYKESEPENPLLSSWESLRFKEKLDLVKGYLPHTFTDNPQIYSIVSSGIHGLSEEQCLEYFLVLKDCILLSLEEQLVEIKKAITRENIKKSLAKIGSEVANARK
ncbi:hypothetical protein RYH73_14335 [Olivibacter sp. CPCC 100613]|uniref:hypothetical protein n=1 Tax=Olivibacter sp. CPCC 100613 TaxID=3079931 RepID=UPI002FFC531F